MTLTPYQQGVIRGWIRDAQKNREDREQTIEIAVAAVDACQLGEVRILFDRYWPLPESLTGAS